MRIGSKRLRVAGECQGFTHGASTVIEVQLGGTLSGSEHRASILLKMPVAPIFFAIGPASLGARQRRSDQPTTPDALARRQFLVGGPRPGRVVGPIRDAVRCVRRCSGRNSLALHHGLFLKNSQTARADAFPLRICRCRRRKARQRFVCPVKSLLARRVTDTVCTVVVPGRARSRKCIVWAFVPCSDD